MECDVNYTCIVRGSAVFIVSDQIPNPAIHSSHVCGSLCWELCIYGMYEHTQFDTMLCNYATQLWTANHFSFNQSEPTQNIYKYAIKDDAKWYARNIHTICLSDKWPDMTKHFHPSCVL